MSATLGRAEARFRVTSSAPSTGPNGVKERSSHHLEALVDLDDHAPA